MLYKEVVVVRQVRLVQLVQLVRLGQPVLVRRLQVKPFKTNRQTERQVEHRQDLSVPMVFVF
jgi:hypothetical protein